jgi:hypothetical protein
LESADVTTIANALPGADAVVFTAGARGKDLDKTSAIDLDAAVVKEWKSSVNANVKRYIMVLAYGADEREF